MENLLTGIRPTGHLHYGHLIGTVQKWTELQNKYNTFIEIADVQALTDNFDNPEKVRENVRKLAVDLLSSGIDPEKATIFIQSKVPEITELTLYFSNLVTLARLMRNPTVKSEIEQKKLIFGDNGEGVTYGFVGYPINQAADITIFNAKVVPVGEDQLPLIEQCREIVRKFNRVYGDTLIEPNPILSKNTRIKGLDGQEKMGKSLGNAIYLADSDEIIEKKVMQAVTDPNKIKKDDPANPEVCMVYYYHQLLNKENVQKVCQECKSGTRGCVGCKRELINAIQDDLKEFREKKKYYDANPEEVDKILLEGTKKARGIAEETMKKIRGNMKINYFENGEEEER